MVWCEINGVNQVHIEPGKPNQNAYIERFNRTFRHVVLNLHLFRSLSQVREIAWEWLIDYNEQQPHDSLGGMTPTAFRRSTEAGNSSYALCA